MLTSEYSLAELVIVGTITVFINCAWLYQLVNKILVNFLRKDIKFRITKIENKVENIGDKKKFLKRTSIRIKRIFTSFKKIFDYEKNEKGINTW